MKTNDNLLEFIDSKGIKDLINSLYDLTGLSCALIDLNGTILTYQDGTPISAGFINSSIKILQKKPAKLKEYINQALNSHDAIQVDESSADNVFNLAVPVYVDGENSTNILIAEFNLKKPEQVIIQKYHKILNSIAHIMGLICLEDKRCLKTKQTHEERDKTLQFHLNILKNVRNCIIVYDLQGKIIYWNDGAESVYGYTEEEMIGQNIKKLYLDHQKQLFKPDIQEIMKKGELTGEWEGKRKDGSNVSVDIRETVLFDGNKEIIGIIGVSKDITTRKEAELRIKESLEEKELLLQEIHHRVKNNLQIISSILNLQSEHVDDAESLNILLDSQNRVKTMAMVHEKLYESSNLKDINFKEYIEDLISYLLYSYGVGLDDIKTQISLEDFKIDIDTAIPCGLIINELLTNSIKYAFPNGKGTLKVELTRLSDQIKLVVADNGIGLPENIDLENIDTLGIKMVNNLIYQLDGALEVDRTGGTEFTIKFKELKYKNRI